MVCESPTFMLVTVLKPNPLSVLQGKFEPDGFSGDVSGCPNGIGLDNAMCPLTVDDRKAIAARTFLSAIFEELRECELSNSKLQWQYMDEDPQSGYKGMLVEQSVEGFLSNSLDT